MPARLSIEVVQQRFISAGYIPLFDSYKNVDKKLLAECPNGHRREITLRAIECNQRCRQCYREDSRKGLLQRKPLEQVIELIQERGYTLHVETYQQISAKAKLTCPAGHEFDSLLSNFLAGHGCPKCAIAKRTKIRTIDPNKKKKPKSGKRKTTLEVVSLVESRGYFLNVETYRTIGQHKSDLTCPEGHQFSTFLSNFLAGHGCPKCSIRRGPKNNMWNPDLTEEERSTRRDLDQRVRDWRKAVYERDWFHCQKCGIHSRDLAAHHLWNYKTHPELRYEISNGITFCRSCHEQFHSRYGNKANNPDQVRDFLGKDLTSTIAPSF